jgi:serine/threonine protein kinase
MHRHEFLHRDLKPENIFLQDNHAKIGDLGFACTIQEAQNRDPSGTPAFAAPECFRGAKSSIKSDSWSLGCLAFEILTGGKALFAFKDPLDALYYFYTDRPSDVQKKINARIELAPPQYRKLLKGLLTLDPAKRMTAEEFYTEFSKLPVPR